MPAPALRFEEPNFREGLARYIVATCSRYRVRRADVEDVVQESLANIVASLKTFRPDLGEFDAWARGVALNVIRTHARGVRRDAAFFSDDHPDVANYPSVDPSPEWCTRRAEARSAILNATGKISSLNVQVLVLHAVDELTHPDIGHELRISTANSEKCYQRTRNHLARCIENDILSMVPPFVSGCDDSVSLNKTGSRWTERSHYAVQFAAAIMAVLLAFSRYSSTTTEMGGQSLGLVKNTALNRSDERVGVHDEPNVLRDAPNVKPELASLPSVRVVAPPAKAVDKPPPIPQYVPRLSHKHTPRTSDHRPLGR